MKISEMPDFGPLQGVTVVCAGLATAGPYAATLMGEFGAHVINIENSKYPDQNRSSMIFDQDHRNQLDIALNIPSEEGRKILFQLLKKADILIENSKGGTWRKWGLDDDVLWEVNPALVIVHISGFGLTGDPSYIKRASWDGVGNAFGTVTALNGTPETPMNIIPMICDEKTALYGSWAALAALYRARETGEGESIDLAQFEAMVRGQSGSALRALTTGVQPKRLSGFHEVCGGFATYKCKDGEFIFVGFSGVPALEKGLPFLGLPEWGSELFPKSEYQWVPQGTEGARVLTERLVEYCASKNVWEADQELNANGIPSCPVMTYEMAYNNVQYQAREVFMKWETFDGEELTGVGVIPKLTKAPGKVWRPAPKYGMDNEDILEELGYTPEQISELYEKGVLNNFERYAV